jgi:hypothetical protein
MVETLVKRVVNNMLRPSAIDQIRASIEIGLQILVEQGNISAYSGLGVSYTKHKPLRYVGNLPQGAKPGDPLIGQVNFLDGSSKPEYRGVILSADGDGNGIVFAKPEHPGEVRVQCKVKANFPMDYISVEVVHGTE